MDSFHRLGLNQKKVHRHLTGKYYSESNGAAILLGRVDLRVDHGHFGNHIKIQESPRADIPLRLSRIGTGTERHGGRPSQEQTANPPLPT